MTTIGRAVLLSATVIVIASGVWLTVSGRPFGTGLQNVHKLVALAGFVYLGVIVWQSRNGSLSGVLLTLVVSTAVLALASLASGGVVSAMSDALKGVVWLHRVASWLSLGSGLWLGWLVSSAG